MSNVKVQFRIGKESTSTFDAVNPLGAANFIQEIRNEMSKDLREIAEFDIDYLKRTLPHVVEDSYNDAVNFAAKRMIGTSSPRGRPVETRNNVYKDIRGPAVEITTATGKDANGESILSGGTSVIARWKALSTRTIKEQNALTGVRNSGLFYLQTKSLQNELLNNSRSIVKRTGNTQVQYRQGGRFAAITAASRRVSVADFKIIILPNVSRGTIPGLVSSNPLDVDSSLSFEKKLGLSADAIKKLSGASNGDYVIPGTHRPLLQPVFTFWTLFRVPRVIAGALAKAIAGGPKPTTERVLRSHISTKAEAREAGRIAAAGRTGGASSLISRSKK